MLPIHPQPLKNEIFSSWLVRLAFANGFPLHTFYSSLLGYKEPIWSRDTDRHPAAGLLNILSLETGQSTHTLRALTLMSYEGVLFSQLPYIGNAPWVLPLGIYHRTRTSKGMQFCPACLQNDKTPAYYRRNWRLALCPICVHHNCLLHQQCPNCNAPIAFHRHGIGRTRTISLDSLFNCHNCYQDLRKTTRVEIPKTKFADQRNWVGLIESMDLQTWNHSPPCATHSLPLFQGIHALLQLMIGRHGVKLRCKIAEALDIQLDVSPQKSHVEFEHLNSHTRLELLWAVCWLLEDWPDRFLETCKTINLSRCYFSEDISSLPFWLAGVIDNHLDRRLYSLTKGEIIAAGNHLASKRISVTPTTLKKLLGLNKHTIGAVWSIWHTYQINSHNSSSQESVSAVSYTHTS